MPGYRGTETLWSEARAFIAYSSPIHQTATLRDPHSDPTASPAAARPATPRTSLIYESDIKRGLIVWNLSDSAVAGAKKLRHLNPQTQEFSFPLKRTEK